MIYIYTICNYIYIYTYIQRYTSITSIDMISPPGGHSAAQRVRPAGRQSHEALHHLVHLAELIAGVHQGIVDPTEERHVPLEMESQAAPPLRAKAPLIY